MSRQKPHRFTAEEKQFLEEYVPGHSHKEIAAEFNKRFPSAVTAEQIKSAVTRYHLNTGRTGRFEKGMASHNKGVKLTSEQYKMAEPTMFKKGHKPHNTYPIGTELVLPDGYMWVKINDVPNAKKNVNWIQKHRLIWEQNFGAIPEGHLVLFKDGDHFNFDPDNLVCVSKQVNLQMARHHLHLGEPDLTDTCVALAEVMCAVGERKRKVER